MSRPGSWALGGFGCSSRGSASSNALSAYQRRPRGVPDKGAADWVGIGGNQAFATLPRKNGPGRLSGLNLEKLCRLGITGDESLEQGDGAFRMEESHSRNPQGLTECTRQFGDSVSQQVSACWFGMRHLDRRPRHNDRSPPLVRISIAMG